MKVWIASVAAAALLQNASLGWAVQITRTGTERVPLTAQERGPSAVETVQNEANSTDGDSTEVSAAFFHGDTAADITNECLTYHNEKRVDRLPHPLPPMTRDEVAVGQAMKYMRQWVKKGCPHKLKHSDEPGFGENLYSAAGVPTCRRAVDLWYKEIELYNGKYWHKSWPNGAGHFTQVMWKSSVSLGCAVAVGCKTWKVIVCNYRPPGNFTNQVPFSEAFWNDLMKREAAGGGAQDDAKRLIKDNPVDNFKKIHLGNNSGGNLLNDNGLNGDLFKDVNLKDLIKGPFNGNPFKDNPLPNHPLRDNPLRDNPFNERMNGGHFNHRVIHLDRNNNNANNDRVHNDAINNQPGNGEPFKEPNIDDLLKESSGGSSPTRVSFGGMTLAATLTASVTILFLV